VFNRLYSVALDGEVEEFEVVRASRIALHVRRLEPRSTSVWTVKKRTWRSGTKQFYASPADALVAAMKQRQRTIATLTEAIADQWERLEAQRRELKQLKMRELADL
jgi:hypothetical protein